MKLWLLRPIDENAGPWAPTYDLMFGFVIRAETEQQAREIAEENGGCENEEGYYSSALKVVWCDSALVSCVELTAEGEPGVVIHDFNAG